MFSASQPAAAVGPPQVRSPLRSHAHSCAVKLIKQTSRAPCQQGRTFGCLDNSTIWVSNCRGSFRCAPGGKQVDCGYPPGKWRYHCDCDPTVQHPAALHAPSASAVHHVPVEVRPPDGCTGPRPRWGTSLCWYEVERSPLLTNVTWIHVPKCGSSFARLVFRGACGAVPSNLTHVDFVEASAMQPIIERHCPAVFHRFGSWHRALSPSDASLCGHELVCVTTLRTTWRRVVSGFYHNLHDCQWMQAAHNIDETYGARKDARGLSFYDTYTEAQVRLYASCVSTCTTRMITGQACGRCTGALSRTQAAQCIERVWLDAISGAAVEYTALNASYLSRLAWFATKPSLRIARRSAIADSQPAVDPDPPPNTARALHILSRFSFVGLLDEWNSTVSEFSRRFGVASVPSDYKVLRAGSTKWVRSKRRREMTERTLMNFSFTSDDALVHAAAKQLRLRRGSTRVR